MNKQLLKTLSVDVLSSRKKLRKNLGEGGGGVEFTSPLVCLRVDSEASAFILKIKAIGRRSRYVTLPWQQNVWITTNRLRHFKKVYSHHRQPKLNTGTRTWLLLAIGVVLQTVIYKGLYGMDKAEQWFLDCPSLEANNSAEKLPPASIPPEIQRRDVAVPCPFINSQLLPQIVH